jgi:hypothetical protein
MLPESKDPNERLQHDKNSWIWCSRSAAIYRDSRPVATDQDAEKVFRNVLEPMLELSKCPDLILNRGHYFGTKQFTGGEPGLSDEDKQALIAFLKRF